MRCAPPKTKGFRPLSRRPISPPPSLDDIAKATDRLGYEVDVIRYQFIYSDILLRWGSPLIYDMMLYNIIRTKEADEKTVTAAIEIFEF